VVRGGRDVLYLDKVEPDRTLRVVVPVGRQVSVLTTALGAPWSRRGASDAQLSAYTADGNRVVDKFAERFSEARLCGFAMEREENEAGICCVRALRRPTGRPVAVASPDRAARMTATGSTVWGSGCAKCYEFRRRQGFPLRRVRHAGWR